MATWNASLPAYAAGSQPLRRHSVGPFEFVAGGDPALVGDADKATLTAGHAGAYLTFVQVDANAYLRPVLGVTTTGEDASPRRLIWQGTIPAAGNVALRIDVGADDVITAKISDTAANPGTAQTLTSEDGAPLSGEIVDVIVTTIPNGTVAARIRTYPEWLPINGATAGSTYVPGGTFRSRNYYGEGFRTRSLVIAGFADDSVAANRADVTVQVDLGVVP